MAYYVGRKLSLNPNEILDTWTGPELMVSYGVYANEETQQNYAEWKALDPKTRQTVEKPAEYAVRFIEV